MFVPVSDCVSRTACQRQDDRFAEFNLCVVFDKEFDIHRGLPCLYFDWAGGTNPVVIRRYCYTRWIHGIIQVETSHRCSTAEVDCHIMRTGIFFHLACFFCESSLWHIVIYDRQHK